MRIFQLQLVGPLESSETHSGGFEIHAYRGHPGFLTMRVIYCGVRAMSSSPVLSWTHRSLLSLPG